MKKIKIKYLMSLSLAVLGFSCTKMNDLHQGWLDKGEAVYSARMDSVKILPGNGRVVVDAYYSAQRIKEAVISWNNGEDEIVVPIPENAKKLSQEIKLPEGSYVFNVSTRDFYGNKSLKVEAVGRSYGENALSTLIHRYLNIPQYVNVSTVQLRFGYADPREIWSELKYTNLNGEEHEIIVPTDQALITLSDININRKVSYRTLLLPFEHAVDTVRLAYVDVELPEYSLALNKSIIKKLQLPGDAGVQPGWFDFWHMLDGQFTVNDGYLPADYSTVYPQTLTLDLNVTIKLKYFKHWPRYTPPGCPAPTEFPSGCFEASHIKEMEVYGSNDYEAIKDGSWNGWTKIADCISTIPSGSSTPKLSDVNMVTNREIGEKYEFTDNSNAYRYIRFKILGTWGNTYYCIRQLSFWGDDSVN